MGWIEHLGLNVPDVDQALAYYDEFMPLVGYARHFPTRDTSRPTGREHRSSSIPHSKRSRTRGCALVCRTSPSW